MVCKNLRAMLKLSQRIRVSLKNANAKPLYRYSVSLFKSKFKEIFELDLIHIKITPNMFNSQCNSNLIWRVHSNLPAGGELHLTNLDETPIVLGFQTRLRAIAAEQN